MATNCPHCGAKVFLPGHLVIGFLTLAVALVSFALWFAGR